MSAPRELARAALWFASLGAPVLPLQPGRKVPYRGSRGVLDATVDPVLIAHWWELRPWSNVGVATGYLFDAVDVDGPAGIRSWVRAGQPARVLGIVDTPRPGGSHLWVPATGCRNRVGMLPGVDYRGLGGYVVAPPSRLFIGEADHSGCYSWRRDLDLGQLLAAVR